MQACCKCGNQTNPDPGDVDPRGREEEGRVNSHWRLSYDSHRCHHINYRTNGAVTVAIQLTVNFRKRLSHHSTKSHTIGLWSSSTSWNRLINCSLLLFSINCSALYSPSHPNTHYLGQGQCNVTATVYNPHTHVCCDGCVSPWKPWIDHVRSQLLILFRAPRLSSTECFFPCKS